MPVVPGRKWGGVGHGGEGDGSGLLRVRFRRAASLWVTFVSREQTQVPRRAEMRDILRVLAVARKYRGKGVSRVRVSRERVHVLDGFVGSS